MTAEPERETNAEEVADELMDIERETVGDDRISCEIVDVESRSSSYRVTVEFPDGSTRRKRFDKPVTWSESYEFVELLHSLGFENAAGVEQLPGTRCEVWVGEDDEWDFTALRGRIDWVEERVDNHTMVSAFTGLLTGYIVILALVMDQAEQVVAMHFLDAGVVLFGALTFLAMMGMGALIGTIVYEDFL